MLQRHGPRLSADRPSRAGRDRRRCRKWLVKRFAVQVLAADAFCAAPALADQIARLRCLESGRSATTEPPQRGRARPWLACVEVSGVRRGIGESARRRPPSALHRDEPGRTRRSRHPGLGGTPWPCSSCLPVHPRSQSSPPSRSTNTRLIRATGPPPLRLAAPPLPRRVGIADALALSPPLLKLIATAASLS